MTLPIAGIPTTVAVTGKVVLSLRSRDIASAKARFTEAYAALARHWDSVRAGPKPLTHKQLVALAGECYRAKVERFETDPDLVPHGVEAIAREFAEGVDHYLRNGAADMEDAQFQAALDMDGGPVHLAFAARGDSFVSHGEAIEAALGPEADRLIAEHQLCVDEITRDRLLQEIATATYAFMDKVKRNMAGDYSPDPVASRFPAGATHARIGSVSQRPCRC